MSKKIKISIGIVAVLVLIQFIHPEKNNGIADGENDITQTVNTSAEVKNILQTSCYDCHSNHTEYPWYANIQPVAGWLAHHVDEGKQELNFSEFKTYKLKRKTHKLKEVVEQLEKAEMPMPSYLWIHKNAVLNQQQKQLLMDWAKQSIVTLNDTLH